MIACMVSSGPAGVPVSGYLTPGRPWYDREEIQHEGGEKAGGGKTMSAVDDFKDKFDSEGRLRAQNGSVAVVFATKGGGRFPGRLHFNNGSCVRAEMGIGDW